MSNSPKQWYVLYTKSGCEKKVANLLSRKNIENYYPLTRQCNRRKKVVLEPLFTSYVFIATSDVAKLNIRMTDSVVNLVYWLGKPVVIMNEEIEIIKRFLEEYVNVKLEKVPFDTEGKVTLPGSVHEKDHSQMVSVNNGTVKMVLPSLGYMILAATGEKSNAEIKTVVKQPGAFAEKYRFAI